MAMNTEYLTEIADAGATKVTHIGLVVDGLETEVSGGTYARQPVTWTNTDGTIRPSTDLTFDIPAGTTVVGWRGYDSLAGATTLGGNANLGGADFTTPESFENDGQFTLIAASSGIVHSAT